MTATAFCSDHPRQLRASLTYSRYPECTWCELPVQVKNIISTRILKAPLPTFILITDDTLSCPRWRRLVLPPISTPSHSTISSSSSSSTNGRPRVLTMSNNELLIAVDAQTQLTFKSPFVVEISINVNTSSSKVSVRRTIWEPFLWRCGLCVANFTIVEENSMELVAAHMRLHFELRCCLSCNTILPNSALAVDAPDAQQHRCADLLTSSPHNQQLLIQRLSSESQIGAMESLPCIKAEPVVSHFPPPLKYDDASLEAGIAFKSGESKTKKRYCFPCNRAFDSFMQYHRHWKNVHSSNRFMCPDCGVSFSTKGNMTTHIQRIHNLKDSMPCPKCSKRCSTRFNLMRHTQLVHSDSVNPSKHVDASQTPLPDQTNQNEHGSKGYYLYMQRQTAPPKVVLSPKVNRIIEENNSTALVADVSMVSRKKKTVSILSVKLSGSCDWPEEIRMLPSPKPPSLKREDHNTSP